MTTDPSTSAAEPARARFSGYQKFVVAVLAFLQFTIVLDFMLLAPLGALVTPALRITPGQFGMVVSAYAFSAGVSGILAAGFADRFDRKKLLLAFYAGFMFGTLLCALAHSYAMLLLARMVTGLFAGVVGAASMAIVTDLFPLSMRGRVMGFIQSAFAASTVLGLPLSLALSSRWGWNAPFFLIVAVCTAVGAAVLGRLRPVNAHLALRPDKSPLHHLLHTLGTRAYLVGFATTALLTMGGFMLMPYSTLFLVHNVGIPVERLSLVYLATGLVSAVAGPAIGRLSDALGKFRVFAFGCAATIVMVLIYTRLSGVALWTLIGVSALLQIGIFSRMISSSALISALPSPTDRGAYMSVSSSLQQVSGGLAAMLGGAIVTQAGGGRLLHFDVLGDLLVGTTLASFALMYFVNRRVTGAAAAPAAALPLENEA
ncbi:MFS transporter [Fulvimonas soli]|uniref:Putative MFS family arabinose efflux permease n=1 Tax=Fulvimonas soli TaxID=155197 RepID=A0A316IXW9_9GAMM|nr:MFS transporter [Fulvimonas soli]PWK92035.1 putative MFS family arabinose efflux permease [Fulvimonas soli]TNY25209.1 MFS transporter [Fulvimonas soli]